MEMNKTTRSDLYKVDPRLIEVQKGFNVRQDFSVDDIIDSIKRDGVIQPMTVIPFKDSEGVEKYRLIDGERRYRAAMRAIEEGATIARVPVMFLSKSKTEEELLIEQVTRNEGKRFNEYEYGIMFERFRTNFGYTVAEIADKFCKQASYISQCLQLLTCNQEIQQALKENKVSASVVREVTRSTDDETKQVEAVNSAIQNAKSKGKAKATKKDITSIEDSIASKNAKIVKTALEIIFNMAEKYRTENGSVTLDLNQLFNDLNAGKSVEDSFEEMNKVYSSAM